MKRIKISKSNAKRLKVITILLAVVIFGTLLLIRSFAAVNTASIQPETGTFTGPAVPIAITGASGPGNNTAQFKSGGSTTPIQRMMASAPYYGAAINWPNANVSYQTAYNTHVQRVGKGKNPDMLRTFDTSLTGVWKWSDLSKPNVAGYDGGVWNSFKIDFAKASTGSQNSAWTASIKTIPINGRPKLITVHHEPENDVPSTNPDAWILNWIKSTVQIGRAIKAANHPEVVYGPIFMGKNYISDTPQTQSNNLHHFMKVASDNGLLDDLNEVTDFIGWDPYHEGSDLVPPKLDAPRDDFKYWFDIPYSFTQQYFPGKVVAVGETGLLNTVSETYRTAWLKTIKTWADNHPGKVLSVCYFDASIEKPWYLSLGPNGTISEPYQKLTAEYWGSLYK